MRTFNIFALLILAASALFAQSTSQPSTRDGGSTPAPNTTVNPAPQSALIRILTPVANQSSANNSVQVRFELTNPRAAAGDPNFVIQLDGSDPITTTSTEHTFTGLTPGSHSVTVILVDANGTPLAGGRAVVQFTVKAPPVPGAGRSAVQPPLRKLPASIPSGSLSILSVIGFGVLIGGVASSMRTRR